MKRITFSVILIHRLKIQHHHWLPLIKMRAFFRFDGPSFRERFDWNSRKNRKSRVRLSEYRSQSFFVVEL